MHDYARAVLELIVANGPVTRARLIELARDHFGVPVPPARLDG